MATDAILTIQAAIAKSGLPVKTAGPVRVVRNVSGSSRPSQHSFENAMDYYPSTSDEAAAAKRGERVKSLESLYVWLNAKKLTGQLPAATICYYRRGGCTTDHLDHLHVDGDPHVDQLVTDGKAGDPGPAPPGAEAGFGRGSQTTLDPDDLLTGQIENPFDFLRLLTSGELWVRVGFVLGGFLAIGAGVYFIAKEFGAPSVTSVAGAAVKSKLPI
jgi:hypothetical protein